MLLQSYCCCSYVLGLDVDEHALDIFLENAADCDISNIDLVRADVLNLPQSLYQSFDTVVMNPPFGTKHNKGRCVMKRFGVTLHILNRLMDAFF